MIRRINYFYNIGKKYAKNPYFLSVKKKSNEEFIKTPSRTIVLNKLIERFGDSTYLEIGVRNPEDNFNQVRASKKYSVDPGVEFESNPVDFQMTSDDFFYKLRNDQILNSSIKFDVIFIDGLHLAEQVCKDIKNSLEFLSNDGFIVLHDCNPPSEWHARETFNFDLSPAGGIWNGTTWKAFVNYRNMSDLGACCIDSDWGIGILSKELFKNKPVEVSNPYYEYHIFDKNRTESLNLISFDAFIEELEK